ncbi:hypothetical protein GCM10018965_002970 [Nonomuraea roseola]
MCFYTDLAATNRVCSTPNSGSTNCYSTPVRAYFDNGAVHAGADHVYAYTGSRYSGLTFVNCIHRGWDEGRGSYSKSIPISYIEWGPECP